VRAARSACSFFSQYIEAGFAAALLAGVPGGVGYLLKDRVADVSELIEAISRVARGGTVLDSEVVSQLLGACHRAARRFTPGSGCHHRLSGLHMTDAGDRGACEMLLTGQVMRIHPFHRRSAVVWRGVARS
jgi:DNA-binding NarL/FixJ family response regulator